MDYTNHESGFNHHSDGSAPRRPRQRIRTSGQGATYERATSYKPHAEGERPRFQAENTGERSFQPRPRFRSENQEGGFQARPRFRSENPGEHKFQPRTRNPRFNSNTEAQAGGFTRHNSFSKKREKTASPDSKYSSRKRMVYKEKYEDPTKPIRLNKFLANAGICSRREADDFIQAGVITVNGEVVCELGAKVLPTDVVKFHDQPVRRERKMYILLNKPKNCVTTTDDPQERHTVTDIVKNACSERIYPVGRLDRNTTGVLLLTNDGDLAAKLTHPKFGKKKIYAATLDRDLSEEAYNEIMAGITLDDELIIPDALAFPKEDDRKHVGIQIHSGQNRVVRRIFEKVGYKVVALDRVSFAGLTKKNVPRGKYRFLTQDEVNMLQMGAFE